MIEERFALCQTLPLAGSGAVMADLRRYGYRPLCYRPYATARGVQVAAVWRRDKVEWQWIQGASAIELTATDKTWHHKGYVPLDVTGYLEGRVGDKQEERYAAVWVRRDETVVDGQMFAGLAGEESYQRAWQPLEQAGYVPQTLTLFEREGQFHRSGVFWKPAQASETNVSNYSGGREWYEGSLSPSYFQVDVRLHHRELTHAPAYWQESLRQATANGREEPG